MRIAIIADIHGNQFALDAVLVRLEKLRPDRIVVAGDIVVGSPDSLACWERVKALRCPILRGNHERYVFDLGTERALPEWSLPRFGPVQYTAAQLGDVVRRELAALPATLRFPEWNDVLFVHGSARSDQDLIFPYTRDEEIEPMFAGADERWVIRGHNHFASVRLWNDRRIVTVGSVGLPLDGTPRAQFTLMERHHDDWRVRHEAVSYDVALAVRRFSETNYLQEGGPMARLFQREVATAAFHVLPFLKWNSRHEADGEKLPLAEAVDRFLGED